MVRPYKTDFLFSKTGHKIYYALYGNPRGIPVLVFHGGPGSYSKDYHVGGLNLQKYNIIMFDQPGSGRSEPSGTITNNTTQIIIQIAQELLQHLQIWDKTNRSQSKNTNYLILKGRSWGASLALLFAISFPDKIKAILLQSVFLANRETADYILNNNLKHGISLFLPERYEQIKVFERTYKINLHKAFNILATSDSNFDPTDIKAKIATALLLSYYIMPSQFIPQKHHFIPEYINEKDVYSMRIFAHFDTNNYFLPDNYILKNSHKLIDIPIHIIHSRYDLDCPFAYTYKLHQNYQTPVYLYHILRDTVVTMNGMK